jgi:hypothetical protein
MSIVTKFELFESESVPLYDLWTIYMGIVDGINDIISEEGELSDAYWKENVEKDLDEITSYVKMKHQVDEKKAEILKNLEELLDGLEGAIGFGSVSEDRYFKKGVINKAKKFLNKYKDR